MQKINHPPLDKALEDIMPGDCYGCGSLNEHGHQIKSFWDGEKAVCSWTPKPFHAAGGPYLYGGIIASLLDCHLCLTGIVGLYAASGRIYGDNTGSEIFAVTANLNVDYVAPTPIDGAIEIEARIISVEGKKVRVEGTLGVNGAVSAKATGLFIRVERQSNERKHS
jgi:acyl-coenzyme A thioesterase PaaI-like protein